MAKESVTKKSRKRKLSTKGKKIIRRTLAGILLISSLVIAAIPSDNSGVAKAGGAGTYGGVEDPISYDDDSNATRNGKLTPVNSSYSLTMSSSDQEYSAYELRKLDGQWTLLWKYKYFVPAGTSVGVITKYNDTYSVPELDLTANAISGFEVVLQSTYDNYVENNINNKTFCLDKTPYINGTSGTNIINTPDDCKKYFPNEYETWKQSYDTALAEYKSTYKQTNGVDMTQAEVDALPLSSLSLTPFSHTGNEMTEEQKRIFYCEHNYAIGTSTYLYGFTLIPVRNYCGFLDSSGNETGMPNLDKDGSEALKLTGSTIYIAVENDNTADSSNRYTVDGVNFRITSTRGIEAIGNNAFENSEKVAHLSVGEGIAYIGDSAFKNSFIQDVNFASVTYIGNNVFEDCVKLTEVTINSSTSIIGKEAFRGCKTLANLQLPSGIKQIGFGAFADCTSLAKLDLSANLGCNIGEYAFYNCPSLNEVYFSDNFSFAFGKACFAMPDGGGTSCTMTEFDFPKNLASYTSAADNSAYTLTCDSTTKLSGSGTTYASMLGDYIFANRYNLNTVVMPENFGTSSEVLIPRHTFSQCIDLGCLQLSSAYNSYLNFDSEYDNDSQTGNGIFKDVQNPQLYVFGPATCNSPGSDGQYYAYPRRATWKCSSGINDYVPYVYFDGTKNHYEVGIKDSASGIDYRYELEVDEASGTAKIISCEFVDISSVPDGSVDLTIPGNVASYTITDMEDSCFNDQFKTKIKKLYVADNSLSTIGANVFSGCPDLEEVILGNSITDIGFQAFANNPSLEWVEIGENIQNIGEEAFYNCPYLEGVDFDRPDNYSTFNSIGTNAFYTGSDKLVFYTDVVDGYAPFEYAMGNNKINSSSVRVCCKETVPSNYTECIESGDPVLVTYSVVLDENNNLPTLIDYPRYNDLDSIITSKYASGTPLNDSETLQLNSTIYLNIPSAVKSVDVCSFLDSDANNPNKKDWIYVPTTYIDLASSNSKVDVYGDEFITGIGGINCSQKYNDAGGYTPGLFSGEMSDGTENSYYTGGTFSEVNVKGNDWIQAVDLPGVTYLPDYCFDSCERLQSVIIGDNCLEIGESAFLGCTDLSGIGTNNNPKYSFDNYILYEKNPDGTLTINTCLPARGENATSNEIWVNKSNDPNIDNVSALKEGAFAGCEYIAKADLSESNISSIPSRAFDGCSRLTEVILPDTVRSISKEAFNHGATTLDITIPCDSNISDEAFDKTKTVTIRTYPECTITGNYNPVGYDKIYIQYIDADYVITYLNDDLSVFEKITVPAGYNGSYPENEPTPKLESHTGYEFSYWYFDNTEGIRNVNENRQALAVFVAPSASPSPSPSASPSPSSKPSGGNNSSNNNNSNGSNNGNNNSSSSNSVSANGSPHKVIVENGAGGGTYEPGKVVTITAYAVNGKQFDKWTTSNTNMGFANAYGISTTFIMPNADVKVTATYKNINSASGNTATGGGNNGTGNGGGSSGASNTGGTTKGDTTGGTTVNITTDAIDNNYKNLASATVAGSTDNFVVKITDSAYASAQVEAALKQKFGNDLSGIKYVAFDISLYDETGTYLIENNENLAVTITVPIPDELAYYAGNNKAAAVINGQIDDKYVKFTTIDGVPCMTFVATHFSPYTIYVDTNNLTSGVADLTPKTGITIKPKWFLSAGLALLGIVLILWKDKKKEVALQ